MYSCLYQTLAEIMSFDSTQRIRPQRQTLEDAYGTPGMYYGSTGCGVWKNKKNYILQWKKMRNIRIFFDIGNWL